VGLLMGVLKPLRLACTYAHIHLVLLVRVHLRGFCMLVPECGLLVEGGVASSQRRWA
jgi:hypothetical protein